jgi:hypothetical protein
MFAKAHGSYRNKGRHKLFSYEIFRCTNCQINGREVPAIAIFRISPRINGVNPAENVHAQSLPVNW